MYGSQIGDSLVKLARSMMISRVAQSYRGSDLGVWEWTLHY